MPPLRIGPRPPFGIPSPGNAGRNPAGFAQGYSPRVQGDELAGQNIRRQEFEQGVIPLDEMIDRVDARNLPPQLVQSSFLVVITQWGYAGAQLLIPKNPRRKAYLVSNFLGSNLLMFTWDAPVNSGANVGAGVPIGGYFQESNGSITINDLWVFCNDPAETFPMTVLGYEGEISIAGNPRG